eukprot:4394802-Amphidinium_carterae.1
MPPSAILPVSEVFGKMFTVYSTCRGLRSHLAVASLEQARCTNRATLHQLPLTANGIACTPP